MSELVFKSAGVSSREIDLSFPTQTQPIGVPAGIIGTADQGPAFIPITFSSYNEFETIFGRSDGEKFGPLAVQQWLSNAQSCTYIRVLGTGNGKRRNSNGTVTNAGYFVGDQLPQAGGSNGSNTYANAGSGDVKGRTFFLGCLMSESNGSTVFSSAGMTGNRSHPIIRGVLLAPSGVLLTLSGNSTSATNDNTPLSTATATDSGNPRAGALTGSLNLSTQNFTLLLNGHKGTDTYPNVITASFDTTSNNYFADSLNTDPLKLEEAGHLLYANYDINSSLAVPTGSGAITAGVYSDGVNDSGKEDIAFLLTSSLGRGVDASSTVPMYEDFRDRFSHARSSFVISQKYGSSYKNLFKIHALSDGAVFNTRYKITIENISRINDKTYPTFDLLVRDFADSDEQPIVLESFRNITLDPNSTRYIARAIGDLNVYYDFDKAALSQKINVTGNHPIRSSFIRVEMSSDANAGNLPVDAMPFGFRGPLSIQTSGSLSNEADSKYTISTLFEGARQLPIPFRENVTVGTGTSKRVNTKLRWGIQFNKKTSTTEPNKPSVLDESMESFVKYFPNHRVGVKNFNEYSDSLNNNIFSLERISVRTGSDGKADSDYWVSASYVREGNISANDTNKTRAMEPVDLEIPSNRRFASFNFFLQNGFDGVNIFNEEKSKLLNVAAKREIADSSQGGVEGSTVSAYKKAIDVMGSKSDVDIKLMSIPGIRVQTVTDYAISAVENRFDAMLLMDIEEKNNSNVIITGSSDNIHVLNTVNNFKSRGLNSSFAAAYFPDVVIQDQTTNTLLSVPPTVAALGAFSLNDAIAHPWFAPAGFSRGALDAVETAAVKLSRKNLDDLYDADINPITSFPGTGMVIWGQKTLLEGASALDRVNVRRLLIDIRRSVRNVANSLLFEPNRQETLDRFNALVNPIMQRVQEKGGVDRYKVVIDASTTTQADVENNTLRGKIFLQPTRAVEFVALDFVVTNAGEIV